MGKKKKGSLTVQKKKPVLDEDGHVEILKGNSLTVRLGGKKKKKKNALKKKKKTD